MRSFVTWLKWALSSAFIFVFNCCRKGRRAYQSARGFSLKHGRTMSYLLVTASWTTMRAAPLPSAAWIPPDDFVRRGIDDSENVLVLQVHVHLAGDGIVLRHPRFTVEMQSLDDFVLGHVHDGFGFSAFVRDIELVKRSRVRASIRLCFRLQFLHDFHLLQIHDTDRVVAGV